MSYKKLWIALGLVLVISFAVLGGVGVKVLHNGPPMPSRVVTSDGRMLFDGETIRDGQNVWRWRNPPDFASHRRFQFVLAFSRAAFCLISHRLA